MEKRIKVPDEYKHRIKNLSDNILSARWALEEAADLGQRSQIKLFDVLKEIYSDLDLDPNSITFDHTEQELIIHNVAESESE